MRCTLHAAQTVSLHCARWCRSPLLAQWASKVHEAHQYSIGTTGGAVMEHLYTHAGNAQFWYKTELTHSSYAVLAARVSDIGKV